MRPPAAQRQGAPRRNLMTDAMKPSEDGLGPADETFANALKKSGDKRVTEAHFPTDHSYSDHRLALTTVVLKWLATLQ